MIIWTIKIIRIAGIIFTKRICLSHKILQRVGIISHPKKSIKKSRRLIRRDFLAKQKISLSNDHFFLKILLLNRIRFIIPKNAMKITRVSIGDLGARVARNIMGKPNTMAGKV